jgi:uncharacterized membrane protein
MRQVRRLFFTGLFVTVPIFLTVWLLIWAFNKLDGLRDTKLLKILFESLSHIPFLSFLQNEESGEVFVPKGIGLVVLVLFILFIGVLARYYTGKWLIGILEKIMNRLPIINRVYGGIKQITDSILGRQKHLFQAVVALEYPRKGVWSLGFYTADTTKDISGRISAVNKDAKNLKYVFVPTTPNPTSGYLLLVPEEQLINIPISVEDAVKLIVSGGVVEPGSIIAVPTEDK